MIAEEDIKIGAKVKFKDAVEGGEYFIVEDSDYSASFFTKHTVELCAVQANEDCFTLITDEQPYRKKLDTTLQEGSIAHPILEERKVGKVPIELVDAGFPHALWELAKVLGWAAENKGYKPNDWKQLPDAKSAFQAAASRHRMKPLLGEEFDPESGLHHKVHELFNVIAELELILTGKIK